MSYLLAFLTAAFLLSAEAPELKKIVLRCDQSSIGVLDLREALEERYLCQPITEEKISEIKCFIANYYKENGALLVHVSMPSQEITDGVLQIVITNSRLGEIHYRGNRWVKPKQLGKYIRVHSGEPIHVGRLSEDLAWINRNPFRRADAVFVSGKEPQTTDIELVTYDRFPFRFYGGFDNRGNDGIGTNRTFTGFNMFAGFNIGNFMRIDYQISYQYTASLRFGSLNAHVFRFDMPLPWRHLLSVYYGNSRVHLTTLGSDFHSRGNSQQASGRYVFPSQRGCVSDWTIGYDYKITNNNLQFAEIPIFSSKVALGQFVQGYTYQSQPSWGTLFFNFEIFWQPGRYLSHMSDLAYQTLRPAAKNEYLYGKGAFEATYRFWRFGKLFTRLAGQFSSANLLPSEEFGLGGADTVRGYKERIANGDNGILCNLEFIWDAFSFMCPKFTCPPCNETNQVYNRRKVGDLFSLVAFFDYGFTHVHKKTPFEIPCAYLVSAGPGLRYVFDQYIQARLDWGFELHKIEAEHFGNRLHFSVVGSY